MPASLWWGNSGVLAAHVWTSGGYQIVPGTSKMGRGPLDFLLTNHRETFVTLPSFYLVFFQSEQNLYKKINKTFIKIRGRGFSTILGIACSIADVKFIFSNMGKNVLANTGTVPSDIRTNVNDVVAIKSFDTSKRYHRKLHSKNQ